MSARIISSVIVSTALLGACATAAPDAPTTSVAWEQRTQVVEQPQEILLAAHADGLSDNQRRAIAAFAADWVQLGSGPVTVAAPLGVDPKTQAVAVQTRDLLSAAGATVVFAGYDAPQGGPLKISYQRPLALPAKCGGWESLTATKDNGAYANFGCSIAANMAAQIADPRDLGRARAMDPASAARRDVVMDNYRKGENTSSARDEQASATVSTVVD
ncbi:CpaD family pilus assembly protein [Caulobacter sp. NIBR2454]|uniref:CpaD family pilus assembly protein n=1 Tax=Caulobacter sp. NIBR2454 TaxID=3015996 RepID=UPI0022B6ACCD|nr:CpaD family pilus assembly protein [Caulobacter sp. NIBR2454]